MIRGTTPTIVLKIKNPDFDMTTLSFAHITIENAGGKNKKVFTNTVIDAEEKTVSLDLSQEDTLAYEVGPINVQMKGKTTSDKVVSHKPITTTLSRILEEGII